ncbi:hypothetical protein C8R42DRAFT_646253 [Lentinula raphanica]|nr:hypothetical protein C8R42DRAFT_646253 [Lentinula raphanica]
MILLKRQKFYAVKTMQINYTTYNVQRNQDVINLRTDHCTVMVQSAVNDSRKHPYWKLNTWNFSGFDGWQQNHVISGNCSALNNAQQRGQLERLMTGARSIFVDRDMFMRHAGGGVGHARFVAADDSSSDDALDNKEEGGESVPPPGNHPDSDDDDGSDFNDDNLDEDEHEDKSDDELGPDDGEDLNGPALSSGAGIFAHTGLNMGGDGSNQPSSLTGQGSGMTTSAGASTGSNSNGVAGQNHEPQLQGGQNTQNQGAQNEGMNTGLAGDEARRAAETELMSNHRNSGRVGPPAPQPILPKSSPQKKQVNKVIPDLPEMIDGHKASPLSLRLYCAVDLLDSLVAFLGVLPTEAIMELDTNCFVPLAPPKKVDDACRLFKYVPYTASLSQAACVKVANGEQEVSLTPGGGLTIKGLDRKNENNIWELDWMQAAKTVAERIRLYHGDKRADALIRHNKLVLKLGTKHSWHRALEYNIGQRELWAADPTHDIGSLDSEAFMLLASHQPVGQPFPQEGNTASTGPGTQTVSSKLHASTSIPGASATPLHMELRDATSQPDPRAIIMLLLPDKIKRLLALLGLAEDWVDVVDGIRNGFDVGLRKVV